MTNVGHQHLATLLEKQGEKKPIEWSEDLVKEAILSEVLPSFMHGGEADEVVAKLDEVMSTKLEKQTYKKN